MPPRRHINKGNVKRFVEKPLAGESLRIPYCVMRNGDVHWGEPEGRHWQMLEQVAETDIAHMGYLQRSKSFEKTNRIGHSGLSKRYPGKVPHVPSEVMGEVEETVREHKKDVNFFRI